jgi:hypothetical protein
MHIVIAIITAIAGLLWALNSLQRSGFDLNSLNPFYWARRKRWEEKQVNPLYGVETPRELTALLMFAVMRQAGDPTEEEKANLLFLYQEELKFNEKQSAEIYSISSHLLNTDPNYMHRVPDLMSPSIQAMTDDQKASIPNLVNRVATFSSSPNTTQTDFIQAITHEIHRSET